MEVADGMEVETGFSNPPSSDLPSDIVGFLRENDLRQLTLADVKREIRKRYYASPPGDAEIEGALDTALARMAAESPLVITAVRAALRRARAETAARKLPVSAPAAPPDAVAEYDEGSTQEQALGGTAATPVGSRPLLSRQCWMAPELREFLGLESDDEGPSPLEIGRSIAEYCKVHRLELARGKTYKTDSRLRALMGGRMLVSGREHVVVETLVKLGLLKCYAPCVI